MAGPARRAPAILALPPRDTGEALESALGSTSEVNYFYDLSGQFTDLALSEPEELQPRICLTTRDR